MSKMEHAYPYSPVQGDEDEAFLGRHNRPTASRATSMPWSTVLVHATAAFAIFSVGVFTGHNLPTTSSAQTTGLVFADTSRYQIFDAIVFEAHDQMFRGSLFNRTVYSGPPNAEMDAAWARYIQAGSKSMTEYPPLMSLPIEDAKMATSYPLDTAVRLAEAPDHGIMGSLGFFHQIHCLDMIRKHIYIEYYEETQPEWFEAPLRRQHADHCIDMLRETLMCHGDTTPIVYHWIEGYGSPVPDFSTTHTCRDPEAILKWTMEHQTVVKEAVLNQGEIGLPEMF